MKKKKLVTERAGEYGLGSFYANKNIMDSIYEQEQDEYAKEGFSKNNTPVSSTEMQLLKNFIFDEFIIGDMEKYINGTNKDAIIKNWEPDLSTVTNVGIFKNDTNDYKIIGENKEMKESKLRRIIRELLIKEISGLGNINKGLKDSKKSLETDIEAAETEISDKRDIEPTKKFTTLSYIASKGIKDSYGTTAGNKSYSALKAQITTDSIAKDKNGKPTTKAKVAANTLKSMPKIQTPFEYNSKTGAGNVVVAAATTADNPAHNTWKGELDAKLAQKNVKINSLLKTISDLNLSVPAGVANTMTAKLSKGSGYEPIGNEKKKK
jgi:hypothetical protein